MVPFKELFCHHFREALVNWPGAASLAGWLAGCCGDRMNETELWVCVCTLLWQDWEQNGLSPPVPGTSFKTPWNFLSEKLVSVMLMR